MTAEATSARPIFLNDHDDLRLPSSTDSLYLEPQLVPPPEYYSSITMEGRNVIEASREYLRPSEQKEHPTGLSLINTRLWIDDLSTKYGRPLTVGTIPDEELDAITGKYDSIWFMGIYQPSEASRDHAKNWAHEYTYAIPDIDPEKDVVSSPFAISDYSPNPLIANGWPEWDTFVDKLHARGEKVFLDFVPNHVALDHPWAKEHPEYFIHGTEQEKNERPNLYHSVIANDGNIYHLAHGKDPNFPEWADTLQLNYAHPDVQDVMQEQLLELVDHADGVRCDMAMLLNPETFLRTWGSNYDTDGNWTGMDHLSKFEKQFISQTEFWPTAIAKAKAKAKALGREDFYFAAEAYWDLEKLGEVFDFMYGKDLYDHLRKLSKGEPSESPDNLRSHLSYIMNAYQQGRHYKDVVFTENHDEERAVKEFGEAPSKAAAVITALLPNTVFLFNQGQENGWRIRPPMQIRRFPDEPRDPEFAAFYDRLMSLKDTRLFQEGTSSLADITWGNRDIVGQQVEIFESLDPEQGIIYLKGGENEQKLGMGAMVLTNFGKHTGSARLPSITRDMDVMVINLTKGRNIDSIDITRDGGMYVELLPWETQVVFYVPKKQHASLAA